MTVRELIEQLEALDQKANVVLIVANETGTRRHEGDAHTVKFIEADSGLDWYRADSVEIHGS